MKISRHQFSSTLFLLIISFSLICCRQDNGRISLFALRTVGPKERRSEARWFFFHPNDHSMRVPASALRTAKVESRLLAKPSRMLSSKPPDLRARLSAPVQA